MLRYRRADGLDGIIIVDITREEVVYELDHGQLLDLEISAHGKR